MDLLIGDHRRGGVGIVVITGAGLEPLHQRQNEHRPEVACEERQGPGAEIGPKRRSDLIAEQGQPVLFVAFLGRGDDGQDLAFLTVVALGEIAVDGGLGAFVGQMSAPAA